MRFNKRKDYNQTGQWGVTIANKRQRNRKEDINSTDGDSIYEIL